MANLQKKAYREMPGTGEPRHGFSKTDVDRMIGWGARTHRRQMWQFDDRLETDPTVEMRIRTVGYQLSAEVDSGRRSSGLSCGPMHSVSPPGGQ